MSEIGRFVYRPSSGKARAIEVVVDQSPAGVISIECPCCERRSRLNPEPRVVREVNAFGKIVERTVPGHKLTVSRHGNAFVDRPIICPNGLCGWFVRFAKEGHKMIAVDSTVDKPREDLPATVFVEEIPSRMPAPKMRLGASATYTMELF